MARQTENYFLCFNECPKHAYKSVSVDLIRADGSGHGTRVTPSKCCGSWTTVRKWMLSASEWKNLADEARRAQRLAARQEKKRKLVDAAVEKFKADRAAAFHHGITQTQAFKISKQKRRA